jgi:hypothetical protein
MIKKEELQYYSNEKYTLKQILNETNYTASQIRYACKKYDLTLASVKRKYNVDKQKVKALLEAGFTATEVSKILKIDRRCVYNAMYRNNWTKKRSYIKSQKNKEVPSRFGMNVSLNYIIRVTLANGTIIETTFKDLFGDNIKKVIIIDKSL